MCNSNIHLKPYLNYQRNTDNAEKVGYNLT